MKLVKCTEEYWEFVRLLRLDERVIDGFIKTDTITPEMQKVYMNKFAEDYRIALFENTPAGYIGVIDNEIRICTHPDFQRKGVGKFMVQNCMDMWSEAFAKIKINNSASIKFFDSCGFKTKYYILKKE